MCRDASEFLMRRIDLCLEKRIMRRRWCKLSVGPLWGCVRVFESSHSGGGCDGGSGIGLVGNYHRVERALFVKRGE